MGHVPVNLIDHADWDTLAGSTCQLPANSPSDAVWCCPEQSSPGDLRQGCSPCARSLNGSAETLPRFPDEPKLHTVKDPFKVT